MKGTNDTGEPSKERLIIGCINRWLGFLDDIILVIVALGIAGSAVLLLYEGMFDFFFYAPNDPEHTISHIISDLMFVLIIMELFRQVMRQLTRHEFSLNPFFFIGVIASIRGLLITQMKLTLGEADWNKGVWQLGVHAGIVLLIVVSYYFYSRAGGESPKKSG
ncbi:MAG: phosphate-starvation-inducible PsiE family protein [Deltaproteobacteria bacterium]|nr:phosphate-starvation-inducible PsiE family protein [Deltaproteobacteria bacterium]